VDVGTLLVRHDPSSAAIVRKEIAADLSAHRITPDSVDDVILVASELVGNAITHVGGEADLDIAWSIDESTVIVRVQDGSTEQPRMRQATPTATNGRGLTIVTALALEWGVHQVGLGKQVWARIAVRHAI
jgi:two-component sensor histidine kinase